MYDNLFSDAEEITRTKSEKAADKFLSRAPDDHDVNKQFTHGNTFLHYVAAKCSYKTILKFLEKGADIMCKNNDQELPVEFAIQKENG